MSIILALRTDNPNAELYLVEQSGQIIDSVIWQAHRELSDTLHHQIHDLLERQKMSWSDLGKVIIYKGPGSFTGLRIGFSVANALAGGLQIPIVAEGGENWLALGASKDGVREPQTPEYGAPVHITQQKK